TVDNSKEQTHEQIELRLAQPVDGLAAGASAGGSPSNSAASIPVAVHLQTQLGRWWPRVATWLNINGLELGGACDLVAQINYSKSGIEIQQIKTGINGFHAWGWNELFIDEPVVQLDAAGAYDATTGTISLNRTTLLTSSISLQTEAAKVAMQKGKPMA